MILVECDICHQKVNIVEGVGIGMPGVNERFTFNTPDGVSLSVLMSKEGTSSQFCKACMWRAISMMIDEMGPGTDWQKFAQTWLRESSPDKIAESRLKAEEERAQEIVDKYRESDRGINEDDRYEWPDDKGTGDGEGDYVPPVPSRTAVPEASADAVAGKTAWDWLGEWAAFRSRRGGPWPFGRS